MQNRRRNRLFGSAALIVSACVWGFAFIAQHSAAVGQLDAIAFNGLRFVLAAAALAMVYAVFELIHKKRGTKSVPWNKETLIGGVLCGIALYIAANLQQIGIASTTVGKASFITVMYIVFVPVLGLLAGRKPSIFSAYAVALAVVGFYFISIYDEKFTATSGDAFVLFAAMLLAIQILFVDMFARETDPIKLTLVQFVTCALIGIPAMGIVGFPTPAEIGANAWELLYMGIMSAGVGFTLQTIGQKHVDPSVATLMMCLESVFGILGGAIVLHESHSARELAGCLIVLIAVFLAQFEVPHTLLKFDKHKFLTTGGSRSFFG